jgi:hypothetical protein
MKEDPSNQLLEQLIESEEVERLRRATLESGLAGLRQRRARHRVIRICAAAGLLALPVAVAFFYRDLTTRLAGTAPRPAPTTAMMGPSQDQRTKIISDEELFALFPGRALALVGTPGHQQLVFLDELDSSRSYVTR